MRTIDTTVVHRTYTSDVMAEISTQNANLANVIAWADQNPVSWKIVTGRRSKAFGIGSCQYIGWAQRSNAPEAVLERLRHLNELLTGKGVYQNPESIFAWRARFTFERYEDKRFKGGFFQQWDAKYPRSCLTLDYTPSTLDIVVQKFMAWMDHFYETKRITLDGKTLRGFE